MLLIFYLIATFVHWQDKLDFDDDLRNLSAEFCDELNHDFLGLFKSSVDASQSTNVDVDDEDYVAKVLYKLTVCVHYITINKL